MKDFHKFNYLFTYCLLDNAISKPYYRALNDRVISN
jgi:hypothetical protein